MMNVASLLFCRYMQFFGKELMSELWMNFVFLLTELHIKTSERGTESTPFTNVCFVPLHVI
jgi:hypothetical protein